MKMYSVQFYYLKKDGCKVGGFQASLLKLSPELLLRILIRVLSDSGSPEYLAFPNLHLSPNHSSAFLLRRAVIGWELYIFMPKLYAFRDFDGMFIDFLDWANVS